MQKYDHKKIEKKWPAQLKKVESGKQNVKKYNHQKIEKHWQKYWSAKKIYKTKEGGKKPKCYVLDMFPYPSGEGLHVGHPRGYIATDVYSRFKRMNGFNVLHPMGFDSFGLPAENYAIKNKIHPEIAVKNNVKKFKKQLGLIGFDYDWDREIITSDPNFYKWTQWIFLKMFEKGLAYESYEPINFCPSCLTGLANEDVEDGKCERCATPVIKKPMRQWMLKITDYAERLLEDLGELKNWPEHIKEAQRNWIGKSEGTEIDFQISQNNPKPNFLILHGYTGRADKNFIPWLKKELEKNGYNVQSPQMPNTDNPTEEEQVSYVLDNCQIDKDTIVVGHSLGAIVAMKVLMKLRKPIRGILLVAASMDPSSQTTSRPFHKTFNWDINFDLLKKLTGFRTVLSDLAESGRINYLDNLANKLNAQLVTGFALKEHFRATEEPLILKVLFPSVKIFTTRIDTIFGVAYLVVAPENKIIEELKGQIKNLEEVEKYIAEAKNKPEMQRTDLAKEKTGVELKGLKAINPFNNEEVPVWVADYVLGGYGTGAVMAVPAHDERDWEFAKKYDLPVKMVICPNYPKPICPVLEKAYTGEGHLVGSGEFDGLDSKTAREKMTEWLEERKLGGKKINYKLKDWVFSRQRYWGEPIPLIHCENCGVKDFKTKLNLDFHGEHRWNAIISGKKTIETRALYLPERKNLRVGDFVRLENKTTRQIKIAKIIEINIFRNLSELFKRQDLIEKIFPDEKISGLSGLEKRYEAVDKGYVSKINEHGLAAWKLELIKAEKIIPVPEKDLPVKLPKVKFYEPTDTGESPLAKMEKWVNVKCPKCGGKGKRETNTMPQWAGSSWYCLAYIMRGISNFQFPISKYRKAFKHWMPIDMYVGGTEHATRHLIYARFWHKFLYDIGIVSGKEPFDSLKNQGLIMGNDGRKMSKRWGNIVNPDDVVNQFGADTLRVYEMFMGPFDQPISWSTDNMVGSKRFLEKIWKLREKLQITNPKLQTNYKSKIPNLKLERLIHQTIKKVTEDIENFHFNTAISSLMILLNEMEKEDSLKIENWKLIIKLLCPFAPHIADELWSELGNKKSIHLEKWPEWDQSKIESDETTIVVQINGKIRGSFKAGKNKSQEEIENIALSLPEIKKYIGESEIKKIFFVKDKIVSIVV